MIAVGCDFGALAAKIAVMDNGRMLSSAIRGITAAPEQVATDLLNAALLDAGLDAADVVCYISTGWGRKRVPFADSQVGEGACLARGAQWLLPSTRTVIDIGGQNIRALSINDAGKIVDSNSNDKCAAGSGRFLEVAAEALELKLEDMAAVAARSQTPAKVSSQCCVFAESEVVTLLNEGRELADIVAGVHDSIVRRIVAIAGPVGIREDILVCGGCAKNRRLIEGLRVHIKLEMKRPEVDPQLVGAIGAALLAQDRLQKQPGT
jgi:predicted CoA-substrate-specific enzyme activase